MQKRLLIGIPVFLASCLSLGACMLAYGSWGIAGYYSESLGSLRPLSPDPQVAAIQAIHDPEKAKAFAIEVVRRNAEETVSVHSLALTSAETWRDYSARLLACLVVNWVLLHLAVLGLWPFLRAKNPRDL